MCDQPKRFPPRGYGRYEFPITKERIPQTTLVGLLRDFNHTAAPGDNGILP